MNEQEKAKELFDKYYKWTESVLISKQCAIIAVDSIIIETNKMFDTMKDFAYILGAKSDNIDKIKPKYWQEVKRQIQNL